MEYLDRAEYLKGLSDHDSNGQDHGAAAATKVRKPGQAGGKEEVGVSCSSALGLLVWGLFGSCLDAALCAAWEHGIDIPAFYCTTYQILPMS